MTRLFTSSPTGASARRRLSLKLCVRTAAPARLRRQAARMRRHQEVRRRPGKNSAGTSAHQRRQPRQSRRAVLVVHRSAHAWNREAIRATRQEGSLHLLHGLSAWTSCWNREPWLSQRRLLPKSQPQMIWCPLLSLCPSCLPTRRRRPRPRLSSEASSLALFSPLQTPLPSSSLDIWSPPLLSLATRSGGLFGSPQDERHCLSLHSRCHSAKN